MERTRARILIVDDDPTMALLAERMLAKHHDTVAVHSADDALRRLESETFDMLLTDRSLSESSGAALIERAQSMQSELRTGLMSGAVGLGAHVLQKPFTPQQLLTFVNELLERSSSS